MSGKSEIRDGLVFLRSCVRSLSLDDINDLIDALEEYQEAVEQKNEMVIEGNIAQIAEILYPDSIGCSDG